MSDLDEVVQLQSDPRVSDFVGALDRAEAEEKLSANERDWDERGYGRFAVIERETGRFIGRSGLKFWTEFEETEAGWTLRPDAWGHGYATEAAQASIDWGFENFDFPYITALIEPRNERSRRVAERLGMTVIREDTHPMGMPVDVFAIDATLK